LAIKLQDKSHKNILHNIKKSKKSYHLVIPSMVGGETTMKQLLSCGKTTLRHCWIYQKTVKLVILC